MKLTDSAKFSSNAETIFSYVRSAASIYFGDTNVLIRGVNYYIVGIGTSFHVILLTQTDLLMSFRITHTEGLQYKAVESY